MRVSKKGLRRLVLSIAVAPFILGGVGSAGLDSAQAAGEDTAVYKAVVTGPGGTYCVLQMCGGPQVCCYIM